MDDLKKIASGQGIVSMYHGTTLDNAANILQKGFQLPQSGTEAAQNVAKLYNIPWTEWKYKINPGMPSHGYYDETRRLSTAPAPVAERWSSGFPQGEIYSGLNADARLAAEAKRRGIPYEDFYNQAGDAANKAGTRSIYTYADAVGAPDLMAPKRPGGALFRLDVDARALPTMHRKDAAYLVDAVNTGKMSEADALSEWNNQYKDVKIAPQNIKNFEMIRGQLEIPPPPEKPYPAPSLSQLITDYKPSRPQSRSYPKRILAMVGDGNPGLSSEVIEDPGYIKLDGETIRHVVYRDERGNPVSAARVSDLADRNPPTAVIDFVTNKEHPESAKGALSVGKFLLENGITAPEDGDISPDALNLLKAAAKLRLVKGK